MSNYRNNHRSAVVAFIALVVIVAGIILIGQGRANAAPPAPLYGGCVEAWQAPQSLGADDCRAKGWTIKSRLVLDPYNRVRIVRVPPCVYEDQSNCYWNAQQMGNGRGDSFVNLRHRIYYASFAWAR